MAEKSPINLFELEALAKSRLDPGMYDYIAGGVTDEVSLRRNRDIFERILLRPRVLAGAGDPTLATTVLGQEVSLPILGAPGGSHDRAHPDAELATARAFGGARSLMVLSSGSTLSLEEVAQAATGPIWFQQFVYRDRDLTCTMADRAKTAGYSALVITVDTIAPPKRERNIKNAVHHDLRALPNFGGAIATDESDVPPIVQSLFDPNVTWSEIAWLTTVTSLPIVVKGVMTGEDAKLAIDHGVSGIIVSNHGARQLDTTLAPIEALPEVAAAVGSVAEVYVDGGIRRGTDVVKALAFGARAVLIGRPIFWGLAAGGEDGVRTCIEILRQELATSMALCGQKDVAHVDPRLVTFTSPLEALTDRGR